MPATLPWPKMPNTPSKSRVLDTVALRVLRGQEAHQRLADGEVNGLRHRDPFVSGRRGSTGWPSQVPRTQPCAGSSQMHQARSGPGPAMTLR